MTKLVASQIGKRNKAFFVRNIERNIKYILCTCQNKRCNLDVVSFSSSKDLYEQIFSILSFLRFVGTPGTWTLYSDGSHQPFQVELLYRHFKFIRIAGAGIKDLNMFESKPALAPYHNELCVFAEKFVMGKKLKYYLNHPINKPTLFVDSDVLFYEHAHHMENMVAGSANGWYMKDVGWGCLDSRFIDTRLKYGEQLNCGFIILTKEVPNIKSGLAFLKELKESYEYFTEQTVFHIIARDNNWVPLDSKLYVLNSDDQFDFKYCFKKEHAAVRHYTGPVRHKMWQRSWKWHLSL